MKRNFFSNINLKSDLKISLDSTNSISKPQFSSLIPSFSCEKKSGKNFIYDNNIIDSSSHLEFMNWSNASQNKFADAFHENNDHNYFNENTHNRKFDNVCFGKYPINSLDNYKISKESYIHELVRSKKNKHMNNHGDFSRDHYHYFNLDSGYEGNLLRENQMPSIDFISNDDFLEKHG